MYGSSHAVTFDAHQIDMRCSNIQKLVDRDVLLKVIRRRRWKVCWDFERIKRELDSPFCNWAEDGEAHGCLTLNWICIQLAMKTASGQSRWKKIATDGFVVSLFLEIARDRVAGIVTALVG